VINVTNYSDLSTLLVHR